MAARSRITRDSIDAEALIVRRLPLGEADLMVGAFTRERGLISVMARGARRARSQFGALEPLHTLRLRVEVAPGSDVAVLREARIERPRLRLLDDPGGLEAATLLLSWLRGLVPAWSPEVPVFDLANGALDALNQDASSSDRVLCEAGLAMLDLLGYGLVLEGCVRCEKPCPDGSVVFLDVARGGVVCRACGGTGALLGGRARALMMGQLALAEATPKEVESALAVVKLACQIHSPLGPRPGSSRF